MQQRRLFCWHPLLNCKKIVWRTNNQKCFRVLVLITISKGNHFRHVCVCVCHFLCGTHKKACMEIRKKPSFANYLHPPCKLRLDAVADAVADEDLIQTKRPIVERVRPTENLSIRSACQKNGISILNNVAEMLTHLSIWEVAARRTMKTRRLTIAAKSSIITVRCNDFLGQVLVHDSDDDNWNWIAFGILYKPKVERTVAVFAAILRVGFDHQKSFQATTAKYQRRRRQWQQ